MAGTFLLYVLLFVFDQTFLEGTATLKLTSLMMTTMAAWCLPVGGRSITQGGGDVFGLCSRLVYRAHYSDRIGNVWIKRLFILIVLIMVVRLLIP